MDANKAGSTIDVDNFRKITFTDIETRDFIHGSDVRKYFSSAFTRLLTKKLHDTGINCNLSRKYNWFKKETSRKKFAPFWYGKYGCDFANCKRIFTALIDEPYTDQFQVSLYFSPLQSAHNLVTKTIRCSGKNRTDLANKILANGVSNARCDLINTKSKIQLITRFYFLENRIDKKPIFIYQCSRVQYIVCIFSTN
jgi:hypothetical protein